MSGLFRCRLANYARGNMYTGRLGLGSRSQFSILTRLLRFQRACGGEGGRGSVPFYDVVKGEVELEGLTEAEGCRVGGPEAGEVLRAVEDKVTSQGQSFVSWRVERMLFGESSGLERSILTSVETTSVDFHGSFNAGGPGRISARSASSGFACTT